MSPKIHPAIWADDDFAALDDAGKVLFLWLITNEATNNIGYLEVSRKALRDDTGKTLEALSSLLQTLPRGFAFEWENGRFRVWIRHFIRHQWDTGQLQPNSRLFPNLRGLYEALPETFQAQFEASYQSLARLFQAAKGLQVPSKGPEQNIPSHPRTSHPIPPKGSAEGGNASTDLPGDDDVLAFGAAFLDLARGITEGMPESWCQGWLGNQLSRGPDRFPKDWRRVMRLDFLRDWNDEPGTRPFQRAHGLTSRPCGSGDGGNSEKNAPPNGRPMSTAQALYLLDQELSAVSAELDAAHQMNAPVSAELREQERGLQKRRGELLSARSDQAHL